jgi:ornithine--oxo-acid transaminase
MDASKEMFWREIAAIGATAAAARLSDEESRAMTEAYGAHNYHPVPVNVVRGKGCRVWDGAGREFIDCVGAYSALAHGHLNEAVLRAVAEQIGKLTLTSRAFYASEPALFLKGLAVYTGLDAVCPMNTGAEAIETCIKIARKWAYTVKGVPNDQAEIVVCAGNFHGRTTTIVGFSTETAYRDAFGPFGPGFKIIPFGDVEALARAVTPNTAAFLAEPIQAESGVVVPPEGFLRQAADVCRNNNVLLIWDEIQTGFCRTGRKFAWMHEDAEPDLVAVGKALGGGILPVSAAVGRARVMDVLKPGDHGSTFGGNPMACAVALAAMAELETHDMAGRAAEMGDRLMAGFRALDLPEIKEVRGKGLLIGLEFGEGIDTKKLAVAFVENGLLTKETRRRTFRFAPPLVVDAQTVDEIVDRARAGIVAARG